MTRKETHRSFIENILREEEHIDRLIGDSIACGVLGNDSPSALPLDGRARTVIVLKIFKALEQTRCVSPNSELSRISDICQAASALRSNLACPYGQIIHAVRP